MEVSNTLMNILQNPQKINWIRLRFGWPYEALSSRLFQIHCDLLCRRRCPLSFTCLTRPITFDSGFSLKLWVMGSSTPTTRNLVHMSPSPWHHAWTGASSSFLQIRQIVSSARLNLQWRGSRSINIHFPLITQNVSSRLWIRHLWELYCLSLSIWSLLPFLGLVLYPFIDTHFNFRLGGAQGRANSHFTPCSWKPRPMLTSFRKR